MRAEKPASRQLGMDAITRRLQTQEGRALLAELLDELAPSIATVDLFEPGAGEMPAGALDRLVFEELSNTFSPAHSAPREVSGAVARVFQRFVDPSGEVSAQSVEAQLGSAGAGLLSRIAAIKDPKRVQALHDRRRLEGLAHPKVIDAAVDDVEVPKMPALLAMAEKVARPGELEGLGFFGLQHLFVSSVGLFDGLAELGVAHEDMRLLGKIYSTNFAAAAHLEARGAEVHEVSKRLISGKSFDRSMHVAIEENLRAMIDTLPRPPEADPKPRFLLIDDGADAIKLLHDQFPEYAPYFIGVEQTRRGARILKELDLKCPVVNVAESQAKLGWESPMIGHSVVLEVGTKLDRLEAHGISTGKEAVVLGYGAVGQAVAKSLQERGFEVHVYDPSPERQALAEKEGMVPHADKKTCLPHGETLVSCVGRRTLFPEDFDLLPDGGILVNAASADDELGPDDLTPLACRNTHRDEDGDVWARFQGQPLCLGLGEATAHSDWVLRQRSGKELLLVNKGYVVNMTGDRDPIPPRYIQLTRTLLFLGAIAANRAEAPGIIDVPAEWQKSLIEVVQSQLAATGEDLLDPNWEVRDGRPPVLAKVLPPSLAAERSSASNERAAATAAAKAERRAERQAHRDLSPDGTLFGFEMGPIQDETSKAAAALHHLGVLDRVMTPFRAAVFQACRDVGQHFNTFLSVSLEGEGEAKVGGGFEVRDADPVQEYTNVYARYMLDFVRAQMGRYSKRAPSADKVARHFLQVLEQSAVNPDHAIAELQRADAKDVRVIAQKAYRLRAPAGG